jgi:serine/threonine protein kinase
MLPLAVLLGLLPLATGQDAALPPAPPPPPPDATRLAYETSDSDELLRPLSSFFPPGTLLGDQAGFALGTTSYRIVGADTRRNAVNATDISDDFLTAVKESFNQEYQTFNLLVRFGAATLAKTVPVVNSSVTSSAGTKAAAAAQAGLGSLVTDPFNSHDQYSAIDIDVTAIAGSDLAAKLPGSWLPLAKNTPLVENAIRQRGYLVTCLTLGANVTEFAAKNVLKLLPSSNSTALEVDLQLFGEDVVPFTGPKQTLLLTTVQLLLPRLFNGIGSRWARLTKVSHSVAAKTVNLTMLAATSSVPKYYEQALVTALLDLPAMMAIAGLPCNVTVRRVSPVSGFTMAWQVRDVLGEPQPAVKPSTQLYVPPPRQLYNVSALDWKNGTLPEGEQVTIGTVKQRLVGQFTTDIPGNNVTAEMMNAFRLMNIARPWNFSLQLKNFTDSTTAKVISPAASESGVFAGARRLSRKLLQVSILTIDTQDRFNTYNDFASLDFVVQFNATRGTRLPPAILPLALPLNLVQAVLRARGIIANVLTLDATLAPQATQLLQQLPPVNSSAVQAAFTLVTPDNAQGAPVVPFTVPVQTAIELVFRAVLPPLSNGLGPRWARVLAYSPGKTPAQGVNVTLLMYNSQTPLSEFLTLVDGALSELSGLLALAGLPVTLTPQYARPVAGYTLEAQLRSALGLPEIEYPVPAPPSNAAALPPADTRSSSGGGGGGVSGAVVGGIVVGVVVIVGLLAAVLAFFVSRSRKHKREAEAEEIRLARSSSGTSMDSKSFRRRNDDSAEQLHQNGSGRTMLNGSPHGTFSLPQSLTKQSIGQLDAALQGWDIDAQNVEICRDAKGEPWLLGEGSYGKVYRGLRGGVQDIAVKVLHASDEAQTRAFRKEISILKSISYDRNIVQFYGAVLTERPMLVLEYMEGGDLREALNDDPNGELRWYRRGQSIALDIARGLHFLHSHDVMHSDMKARNVLLSKGRETAKISDVGVARYLNECATATQSNYVAWTFAYAAPEILLNQKISEKADVYSFGVMLWEIVTGIAPVRGGLSDVSVPEDCPAEISDLIKACLSVDADLRPTAKRCFQIIRASNAGEDAAELQPTFSPSHLSACGSSASLSALTIDSIAEPIVGGTYSAPTSYLGSAPGSVRASSDSAANGTFGAYPPGPGSNGGSWDWSLAERLPSARRSSVASDTSVGSGPSRLRHSSSCWHEADGVEGLPPPQQQQQQQHQRPPSPLQPQPHQAEQPED